MTGILYRNRARPFYVELHFHPCLLYAAKLPSQAEPISCKALLSTACSSPLKYLNFLSIIKLHDAMGNRHVCNLA